MKVLTSNEILLRIVLGYEICNRIWKFAIEFDEKGRKDRKKR